MDSIPAAGTTTPVTIHFSSAGIPGILGIPIPRLDPGKGIWTHHRHHYCCSSLYCIHVDVYPRPTVWMIYRQRTNTTADTGL